MYEWPRLASKYTRQGTGSKAGSLCVQSTQASTPPSPPTQQVLKHVAPRALAVCCCTILLQLTRCYSHSTSDALKPNSHQHSKPWPEVFQPWPAGTCCRCHPSDSRQAPRSICTTAPTQAVQPQHEGLIEATWPQHSKSWPVAPCCSCRCMRLPPLSQHKDMHRHQAATAAPHQPNNCAKCNCAKSKAVLPPLQYSNAVNSCRALPLLPVFPVSACPHVIQVYQVLPKTKLPPCTKHVAHRNRIMQNSTFSFCSPHPLNSYNKCSKHTGTFCTHRCACSLLYVCNEMHAQRCLMHALLCMHITICL